MLNSKKIVISEQHYRLDRERKGSLWSQRGFIFHIVFLKSTVLRRYWVDKKWKSALIKHLKLRFKEDTKGELNSAKILERIRKLQQVELKM